MAHANYHNILFIRKHYTLDMTCGITLKGYILRWDRNAKASAYILRERAGKFSWFGGGSYANVRTISPIVEQFLNDQFPGFVEDRAAFITQH